MSTVSVGVAPVEPGTNSTCTCVEQNSNEIAVGEFLTSSRCATVEKLHSQLVLTHSTAERNASEWRGNSIQDANLVVPPLSTHDPAVCFKSHKKNRREYGERGYRRRSRRASGGFPPDRSRFDRREDGGDGTRGPIGPAGPRAAPMRSISADCFSSGRGMAVPEDFFSAATQITQTVVACANAVTTDEPTTFWTLAFDAFDLRSLPSMLRYLRSSI